VRPRGTRLSDRVQPTRRPKGVGRDRESPADSRERVFRGVFAAHVCPLAADFSVDTAALAGHVAWITAIPGIAGTLTNGHAGENVSLDRAEKRLVLDVVRSAIGPDPLVIAGVSSESSLEAAAQSADAEAAGADAVLIFPPFSWALSRHRETVLAYHRAVIDAVRLPIMLYAAPVGSGQMAYEPELLAELVRLPRVVAIKEGSWETARYDANRRLIKSVKPECAVMASSDEHLLTCFVLGTDGSQVSIACIVPEVVVALYEAVQARDVASARAAHEIIYPLSKAIYGTPPSGYATARIKTCLRILGRLEHDRVRPPIGPLDQAETDRLRGALRQAKLL
jgi:4-hydroxy-tetrahydrodipicolinate synthase